MANATREEVKIKMIVRHHTSDFWYDLIIVSISFRDGKHVNTFFFAVWSPPTPILIRSISGLTRSDRAICFVDFLYQPSEN